MKKVVVLVKGDGDFCVSNNYIKLEYLNGKVCNAENEGSYEQFIFENE